jgi:hypothetical protein
VPKEPFIFCHSEGLQPRGICFFFHCCEFFSNLFGSDGGAKRPRGICFSEFFSGLLSQWPMANGQRPTAQPLPGGD